MLMKLSAALMAIPMMLAVQSVKADESMDQTADVYTEASAPLYTCKLEGRLKGQSIAIGIGGEIIKGNGFLVCRENASRKTEQIPVKFRLAGLGIGIDVTRIKAVLIYSAGIGVNNPSDFYRSYGIGATTGATLGRAGVEFDAAFQVDSRGHGGGFEVGLQGRDVRGLGVHLYAMKFSIKQR